MATWKGIIGKGFRPTEFAAYVSTLTFGEWRPQFVVVHNTSAPRLSQWHSTPGEQRMRNLEHFYRDEQKWSAGPHLFVADDLIWVFTPLTLSGVHSPSWNGIAWGIEMVGEYEVDCVILAAKAPDAAKVRVGRGVRSRAHKKNISALASMEISGAGGVSTRSLRQTWPRKCDQPIWLSDLKTSGFPGRGNRNGVVPNIVQGLTCMSIPKAWQAADRATRSRLFRHQTQSPRTAQPNSIIPHALGSGTEAPTVSQLLSVEFANDPFSSVKTCPPLMLAHSKL
jgi:hypothetical protein